MKYYRLKRIMDLMLSFSLLLFCLPIFIIVFVLILLFMGRPIFFIQRRLGYDEKIFNIIKFRTMNNAKQGSDTDRTTRVGSFLRKASLDELPQLINIFLGEMSFIGPRPLHPEYLNYYTSRERKRHNVLPGLTGLAQVSGRNKLNWDSKLELDVQYVESYSFNEDVKIFFKTIHTIFRREDINYSSDQTMVDLAQYRSNNNTSIS